MGVGKRSLLALTGVVAALTVTVPAVWYGGLRNRFLPNNFGVVEPGRIYRSGQISRQIVRETLAKNHIGLIIDLSSGEGTDDAKAEREASSELGIPRLDLRLRGNGTGDPEMYTQALDAMIDADHHGRAVLVHCQSGSQRTGGVVATYRMLVQGKSAADAFAEAERYGHNSRRNPHLIPFVEEHLPQWSRQLRESNVALAP